MFILLVEDDSITVDALTSQLKDAGHQVYFAGDGLSALTYLATPSQTKPDLILLDYKLPGMDGDELLTRLGTNLVWHSIPTLVMTAASGTEQENLRHKHPGLRILSKPFHIHELLQEISLLDETLT